MKVVVALSGGVDSSVTAALLKQAGYSLAAVFYELWSPTPKHGRGWENNCCSLEAYRDAQRVADKLKIPLFRANIAHEFKRTVVDYFLAEYAAGRTPNPCIVCNTELRFGLMLDRALMKFGADYLATGHYAIRDSVDSWQRKNTESKQNRAKVGADSKNTATHRLLASPDVKKDQSYFLYRLSQKQLGRVLFPIGGMTKPVVRALAKQLGLPTASKHDSQQICFVPNGGVANFLKQELGEQPAAIVDRTGQKIGEHKNAAPVTLGQRRGLGSLGAKAHYVVEKDLVTKTVRVTDDPADPALQLAEIILERPTFIANHNKADGSALSTVFPRTYARGRHGQKLFAVSVAREAGKWRVRAKEKVGMLAAGQALVLYQKTAQGLEVLGGGIIGQAVSCATISTHTKTSRLVLNLNEHEPVFAR